MENVNSVVEKFKTRSLYLAAFLQMRGWQLADIKSDDGVTFFFEFDDVRYGECKELSQAAWAGEEEMNFKEHHDAMKDLKFKMFREKDKAKIAT